MPGFRNDLEVFHKRLDAGLGWPLPPEMTEEELDVRLFRHPEQRRDLSRPVPEWALIHKELRRKAVTLKLLWEEYREIYPDGYGYSQFCEHYRRWAKTIDVCMRQIHRPARSCSWTMPG